MTEVEKVIRELTCKIDQDWAVFMTNDDDYVKEFAPKILEAARKQVASEIDTSSLIKRFANSTHGETPDNMYDYWEKLDNAYRQGIEDTLKAQKGE